MWSRVLLPLLALSPLAASAPTLCMCDELPVCIVGAGPAGLAAAARLEEKGIKAMIFDRQAEVGGKCQAWYDNEYVLHNVHMPTRRG